MLHLYTPKTEPKRVLFTLLSLMFLFSCLQATSQTHTPVTKNIDPTIQGYWEYLPAHYNSSGKNYPLLIFLHGTDEQGNGSKSDLKKVLKNGPPRLISKGKFPKKFTVNGKSFSFIVISPQLNTDWRSDAIFRKLIAYCVKTYRVDVSRIYLTGISMGGGSVWQYSGTTVANAKKIAAQVPICGNYPALDDLAKNMARAGLPTWAIHNKGDNVIGVQTSIDWINKLNNDGINPGARLTVLNRKGHDAWTQGYDPDWRPNGLNVYEWMLQYTRGDNSGAPENKAPVAKIVGDGAITLPVNSLKLDGSYSTDSDGTIKSYAWKYISGPQGYHITNEKKPQLTVSKLSAGIYTFQLTVTDNQKAAGIASFTFTVNKEVDAPVATITGENNIILPNNSTTLDGSNSSSPNGIKSYRWKKLSGSSVFKLSNATSSKVTASKLIEGQYVFQLTVADRKGKKALATFTTTVRKASKLPEVIIKAPTSITNPINSIVLDGSASSSPNGAIKAYGFNWQYVSGPGGWTTANSATSKITVKNLQPGPYTFKLTVTDVKGLKGSGTVSFTVNKGSSNNNPAPVAEIKGSSSVTLPTNSLALDGSGSSSSVGIKSFNWTKTSGPSAYSIKNATKSNVTISRLVEGTYSFKLTVTDKKGLKGSASSTITVKKASTQGTPTVVIKKPSDVILPANSIVLDATGTSSPNGSIKAYGYNWQYKSGPGGWTTKNSATAKITIRGLRQGNYAFKLTVTDVKGMKGSGSVIFKVKRADSSSSVSTAPVIPGKLPSFDPLPVVSFSLDHNNNIIKPVKGEFHPGAYQTLAESFSYNNVQNGIKMTALSSAGSKFSTADLSIYPVPAADQLHLFLNNKILGKAMIVVIDLYGRVLIQKTVVKDLVNWKTDLNISSLNAGAYYVEAIISSSRFSKQFMKVNK